MIIIPIIALSLSFIWLIIASIQSNDNTWSEADLLDPYEDEGFWIIQSVVSNKKLIILDRWYI